MLAAVTDIEHSYDLDVVAGADAAGAEDAPAHIVRDHRIARPLVALAQRELPWGGLDAVFHDISLELVLGVARPPLERCSPGYRSSSRERTSCRVSTAAEERVVTRIPSVIFVAQAGRSLGEPSTETTQIRQLPAIGSLGYQHSVGISIPAARAASRIVAPSGASIERPSSCSLGISN